MRLLIVGSVAIDSVETPFGKAEKALGGSATYASVAASYFTSTGIVAVVGCDFDRRHINLLKRKRIDLEGLQIDSSGKTFFWSGYYEGDMNVAHTRMTDLNVFESFNPVIPKSYRDTPFILLENIHPALQLDVLSQVENPRLVMCDTMNYWIKSEPELLEKVFRKVDVICINEDEARLFCNTPSLPAAASQLLKLGPNYIIIKKGIHGVVLFGKKSFFALPSIPLLKVKDPTGAGDTFAGGTIGYIAKSNRLNEDLLRRALVAGTVMASYCVEDFSCRRTARLKPEEISDRAKQLREYSRIPAFRM
ncbi:MAG: sugar kinase [Candidatus Zixiibacteriota bacterium]|nr:MAG: sugar kinase [candidate division Zixibacteria bacterium]